VAHVAAPLVGMNVADHFGYGALWVLLAGLCGLSYAGMMWLAKRA